MFPAGGACGISPKCWCPVIVVLARRQERMREISSGDRPEFEVDSCLDALVIEIPDLNAKNPAPAEAGMGSSHTVRPVGLEPTTHVLQPRMCTAQIPFKSRHYFAEIDQSRRLCKWA